MPEFDIDLKNISDYDVDNYYCGALNDTSLSPPPTTEYLSQSRKEMRPESTHTSTESP